MRAYTGERDLLGTLFFFRFPSVRISHGVVQVDVVIAFGGNEE